MQLLYITATTRKAEKPIRPRIELGENHELAINLRSQRDCFRPSAKQQKKFKKK